MKSKASMLIAFAIVLGTVDYGTAEPLPQKLEMIDPGSCPAGQCDAAAMAERQKSFAPAQAIPVDKKMVKEIQAIRIGRERANVARGKRRSLPSTAMLMTMEEFNRGLGLGSDPLIANDRQVWVVTVRGDRYTHARPGASPTLHHVYTTVIDAGTGALIMEAIGVDAASIIQQ